MPRPEPIKSSTRAAARPTAVREETGVVPGEDGKENTKKGGEFVEWVKSFGIAIVLFLLIRTFLIQAFSIPSGSMENTLLIGDYLMANNAIYGAHVPFTDTRLPGFREPRHGDIVVFRPTYNDPIIDVVKRVIGEPGDTVQMRDGTVLRNGRPLEEPYAIRQGTPDRPMDRFGPGGYDWHLAAMPAGTGGEAYAPTRDNWGPLVVPAGHFFLMGDNREASLDSRYMGFIPRDVIRGKPLFIYFSYDPYADSAIRFLSAARWGRIGSVIR